LRDLLGSSVTRRLTHVFVLALACVLLVSAAGCKRKNTPIIEFVDAPVSAPTVEATMSVQPSSTPSASTSSSAAAPTGKVTVPGSKGNDITLKGSNAPPAAGTVEAPMKKQAPTNKNTLWPTKVATFHLNYNGEAWWPKSVPAGYKIDSLNVVEFDRGSGLVCDTIWVSGGKMVELIQGSPKNRAYSYTSSGKTAWGTGTADVVRQDPSDLTAPVTIVYNKGGTFAELSGDLTLTQLKAMAASMVPVK
jgi:hypothetical protein